MDIQLTSPEQDHSFPTEAQLAPEQIPVQPVPPPPMVQPLPPEGDKQDTPVLLSLLQDQAAWRQIRVDMELGKEANAIATALAQGQRGEPMLRDLDCLQQRIKKASEHEEAIWNAIGTLARLLFMQHVDAIPW